MILLTKDVVFFIYCIFNLKLKLRFFFVYFVAINYVAVSDALGVSPSVVAAGVAADNVICAIYFMVLFTLGSKIPSEALPPTKGEFKIINNLIFFF